MFKMIKENSKYNTLIQQFVVSTEDEIDDLPAKAPFGSIAFVIESKAFYIRNDVKASSEDEKWTKISE